MRIRSGRSERVRCSAVGRGSGARSRVERWSCRTCSSRSRLRPTPLTAALGPRGGATPGPQRGRRRGGGRGASRTPRRRRRPLCLRAARGASSAVEKPKMRTVTGATGRVCRARASSPLRPTGPSKGANCSAWRRGTPADSPCPLLLPGDGCPPTSSSPPWHPSLPTRKPLARSCRGNQASFSPAQPLVPLDVKRSRALGDR